MGRKLSPAGANRLTFVSVVLIGGVAVVTTVIVVCVATELSAACASAQPLTVAMSPLRLLVSELVENAKPMIATTNAK